MILEKINDNIQNFSIKDLFVQHEYALLSNEDKILLHCVAKSLPENSVVVEVGTFLGVSSAIMANSNQNIEINTFDTYDNDIYSHKQLLLFKKFLGRIKRDYENVKAKHVQFSNINFNKSHSPEDCLTWNKPVDLYFEDGLHVNPYLANNINFWPKFIKPGGLLIFHDYRPNFPKHHWLYFKDVIDWVENLNEQNFNLIMRYGDCALLQKKY